MFGNTPSAACESSCAALENAYTTVHLICSDFAIRVSPTTEGRDGAGAPVLEGSLGPSYFVLPYCRYFHLWRGRTNEYNSMVSV